jgi:rubrerythrin
MTIAQAFTEALGYEKRIRDLYAESARGAEAAEARAFFEFLARDEDSHVAYIEHCIDRWATSQSLSLEGIMTRLPGNIDAAVDKARATLAGAATSGQLVALESALRAEEETSAFYRKLVTQLPGPAAMIFGRLQAIEDGHTAIVKAELDSINGSGHWFDIREFDQED